MHLEASGEQGVGGLHVLAGAQDPPPAERVDDQRRAQFSPVGEHARRRSRRSTLAVSNSNDP